MSFLGYKIKNKVSKINLKYFNLAQLLQFYSASRGISIDSRNSNYDDYGNSNYDAYGKCICHVNPGSFDNEIKDPNQEGITCSLETDLSERAPASRKIHLAC